MRVAEGLPVVRLACGRLPCAHSACQLHVGGLEDFVPGLDPRGGKTAADKRRRWKTNVRNGGNANVSVRHLRAHPRSDFAKTAALPFSAGERMASDRGCEIFHENRHIGISAEFERPSDRVLDECPVANLGIQPAGGEFMQPGRHVDSVGRRQRLEREARLQCVRHA